MKVDLGEKVAVPWSGWVGLDVVESLREFLRQDLWLNRRVYRRELYVDWRTVSLDLIRGSVDET